MIEWATNNGKAARQRSVRQETTMFKAGTLPLNMYRASDYPKDKVSFSHNTIQEGTVTSATTIRTVTPVLHHTRPLRTIKQQRQQRQKRQKRRKSMTLTQTLNILLRTMTRKILQTIWFFFGQLQREEDEWSEFPTRVIWVGDLRYAAFTQPFTILVLQTFFLA